MIVYAVWDLVADVPCLALCARGDDRALAVYEDKGAAVLAAERLGANGWPRDVREMVLDVAPPGGHALPRDTWPSQAVLDVCPGLTTEQVDRRYGR